MKNNCKHKELGLTADGRFEHHWYCLNCKKNSFTNAGISSYFKKKNGEMVVNFSSN